MANPFHLVAVSLTVTDNRVNISGQRTLSLVGDVHNNNNNNIKLLSLWVWQDQLLEGIPAAKVTSAASVCVNESSKSKKNKQNILAEEIQQKFIKQPKHLALYYSERFGLLPNHLSLTETFLMFLYFPEVCGGEDSNAKVLRVKW